MAKDITSKAGQAYSAARENQYVRRLIEDEELRDSLAAAYFAGRKAYGRVSSSRASVAESVANDRKVKRELKNATDALRDASERLREPKKKRHPIRNLLAIGLLTGGLVLVFSETARKTLLDTVFGAEEEFVYTSTTSAEGAPQTNGTPVSDG
ncbi:MAG TPA: hypothetical protein VMF31_06845 [Solirubrobacterales bacterium]|nr:hypothetical protein [Solirubrobacterales bacterium]